MMEKYAKLTGKTQTTVASFEPYLSPTPHGLHPKDQVLPVKVSLDLEELWSYGVIETGFLFTLCSILFTGGVLFHVG